MPFTPFPLQLVANLFEPSRDGVCDNPDFLPFLRWVAGQSEWRSVATLVDRRGFTKPVLPHAIACKIGISSQLLHAESLAQVPVASLDFVQVMAEFAPDELLHALEVIRPRLAPAGLVLAPTGAGEVPGYTGVTLAVGRGGSVLLQPEGAALHAVMAWLQGLEPELIAEFSRFMHYMVAPPVATQPGGRLTSRDAQRHARFTAALRHKLDEALKRERRLQVETAEALRLLDALHASTSWKLTAPLRKTLMTLRTRRRIPAEAPLALPASAPLPNAAHPVARFIGSAEVLTFTPGTLPHLSIVLVIEGASRQALACLRSLAVLPRGTFELVIVGNGPTSETGQLLEQVRGARILRNSVRLSPSQALAEGIAATSGRTLLLLDPCVRLHAAALRAATAALQHRPEIGVVTAKIVATDGSLIEAGAMLGAGGQILAMPPGYSAEMPDTQFSRSVPAGSGLCLLLSRSALSEAGGISTNFQGRAHAVVDLCLRLGELGWKTIYEPLASVGYGEPSDVREAPDETMADGLFAVRHAGAIARHGLLPGRFPPKPLMADDRKRVLLIDDRVPYPELGSGYPRSARMVHELHEAGWFVTVYPNMEPEDDWPTVYEAFPRGVEFMLGFGRAALGHFLHERAGFYDTVIVSRPHNMKEYLSSRHDTPRPSRLVYDAEALFAPREFMRLEQLGRTISPALRHSMLQEEVSLTETADLVTAVNEMEAQVFRGAGCRNVRVLGLGVAPAPVGMGFSTRRDLLFVGAMGDDNTPNADAMIWFVSEIMPVLDSLIGHEYRLLIAGRCQAPRVLGLVNDRVQVLGMVEDLSDLYAAARIFIAPTRYAAGLPLKVHEAAGRGLPVVGTDLLGLQLGWQDGRDMLLAGTAEAFAGACARLYQDPKLWYEIRRGGLDRLLEEERIEDFSTTLLSVVTAPPKRPT